MAKITFLQEGKTVEAHIGERVVDICEREQAIIPFGCQNGICGTCLCSVKGDKKVLAPAEEREINTLDVFGTTPDKHRLACQSVVAKEGHVEFDEP